VSGRASGRARVVLDVVGVGNHFEGCDDSHDGGGSGSGRMGRVRPHG
jgi:hypothetical protein